MCEFRTVIYKWNPLTTAQMTREEMTRDNMTHDEITRDEIGAMK
jgi:hypothetical protein